MKNLHQNGNKNKTKKHRKLCVFFMLLFGEGIIKENNKRSESMRVMDESLEWFQEVKRQFTTNDWVIISETPTELKMKEDVMKKKIYSLRYLEKESKQLITKLPNLAESAITFFHAYESDRENEVDLLFQLEESKFTFTLVMEESVPFVECFLFREGPLTLKHRALLPHIFSSFKEVVMGMAMYRLHFVTGNKQISKPKGDDWIKSIAFT